MTTKTKRFFLPESEIPTQWYNIQADMVNKPMPPLNPATREPLKPSDLYPIFAKALADQELKTHGSTSRRRYANSIRITVRRRWYALTASKRRSALRRTSILKTRV